MGEMLGENDNSVTIRLLTFTTGKGTWGKNGIMYEDENEDPADPNYDIERVGDEKLVLKEVRTVGYIGELKLPATNA